MGNVGTSLSRIYMSEFRLNTRADDSGFFSVAVIERALQVVNLRLVNWESQDMRPYHDNPEFQAGFILNFQSHWFCMRKFGTDDFWFNLNSFLPQPGAVSKSTLSRYHLTQVQFLERVSKLYLGMQLHQAQREGYSVFAVLPPDDGPAHMACLPPCPADTYFLTNPHLAFASFGNSSSAGPSRPQKRSQSPDSPMDDGRETQRRRITPGGSDEEDDMMRRAIEASIAEAQFDPSQTQAVAEGAVRPAVKSLSGSVSPAGTDEEISKALQESHMQPNGHGQAARPQTSVLPVQGSGGTDKEEEEDDDDGTADDAPTIEELRLKRLARFG